MRICSFCNQPHNRTSSLCQRCFNYLKRHPEGTYPLPEYNEIKYADNGDFICHVCGCAYRTLSGHINSVHNMSHNEYCDSFGLLRNTKLCSKDYSEYKKELQRPYYNTVVLDNLIIKGAQTRFKHGQVVPLRGHHIKKER